MSADKANLWFLSLSVIDYNIYLNTLDVAVMAVNICQMKFPHYLRGCGQRIEICTAEEQIMAQFFHSKRGAATCRRSSFVFSVLHFFFNNEAHISLMPAQTRHQCSPKEVWLFAKAMYVCQKQILIHYGPPSGIRPSCHFLPKVTSSSQEVSARKPPAKQ